MTKMSYTTPHYYPKCEIKATEKNWSTIPLSWEYYPLKWRVLNIAFCPHTCTTTVAGPVLSSAHFLTQLGIILPEEQRRAALLQSSVSIKNIDFENG